MTVKLAPAAIAVALVAGLASAAIAQPPAAAPAEAKAPAAAAKPKYSAKTTPLVDLMKNPQTKAILAKHLSAVMDQVEANIDQIPPEFTLETLAEYAQGAVTAESIAAIDADLAKL